MAISIDSQSFRETAQNIEDLQNKGLLNSEKIKELIDKQGFDPQEFKETYDEYIGLTDEEKSRSAKITGLPVVDPLLRLTGRAVGEGARDLKSFSEDVAPNLTKVVSDNFSTVANQIGEYVPEQVKEFADELFDPYHGDGVYGEAEKAIGNIGSYFIPGTLILKGAKAGNTLAKSNKFLNSGLQQARRALGKKGRKAARVAGYLGVGAGAATIAEDPQENIVNVLREQFPESTEVLEGLRINPKDSRLKQRLNAFVNNLGFEVAAVGGITGILKTYNKVKPYTRVVQELFSSRKNMTDKSLELFLKREPAIRNAVEEATTDSKLLSKLMKKKKINDPEDIKKINRALQGEDIIDDVAGTSDQIKINLFGKKTASIKETVQNMRNNIDEMSKFLIENERLSGALEAKVRENLETYVTRSYRAFEDPNYLRDMAKAIKKNKKNITTNQLQSITNKNLEQMASYLIDDLEIEPDAAFNALKNITKNLTPDEVGSFLNGLSSRSTLSTKGGLQKRDELIPDEVKAFLGEIKDPAFNYVNSFKKLAAYKSEINFLEELKKDMLNSGAAEKIVKERAANGKLQDITDAPDNFTKAEDVVDNRLSKVFGGATIRTQGVKNPLSDLYIHPSYKKTLEKGIDGFDPSTSTFSKYVWLPLKTGSQLAVTVFNPLTHARNVLGNVVFMVSNGMSPINGGAFDAAKFTADKLIGLNNKELTQKFNKYKSLGITGTDIASETIRKNLNDIVLKNPEEKRNVIDNLYNKLPKKITDYTIKPVGTVVKKSLGKIIDAYQIEDDVFKIMHFEKSKKDLKKAFPNLSEEALENQAAERTRDLMPNYKIAPTGVKMLRYMPIGDFATFAAESARVAKNLIKYTVNDALSGNAQLTKMAAKRLAGMTIGGIGADYLSEKSKMLVGITDKEEEALKTIGPSWEYFAPQIYLDKKMVGKKPVYDTLSMASLDPFAFPKNAARTTHRLFFDPTINQQLTDAVDKKDVNRLLQPELRKTMVAAFDATLSPFVGSSLATDALLDAAIGVGKKPLSDVALKFIDDTITPAGVDFFNKRKQYELELQTKDKELADKGYPSYALFSERTKGVPGEADFESLLGLKTRRIDINSTVPYNIGYRIKNINKNKQLSNLLRNKPSPTFNLNKKIRERTITKNPLNDDDFIIAKKNDEKLKLRKEQEIQMYLKAYEDLGFNIKDIIREASGRNKTLGGPLQIELNQIRKGKHTPALLTETDIKNAYNLRDNANVRYPREKITEINKKLLGKKISAELYDEITGLK
tara:strand:+ start:906 stop:4724 length:3819 start_codon:yes stop_codon:yes gene_type:complete